MLHYSDTELFLSSVFTCLQEPHRHSIHTTGDREEYLSLCSELGKERTTPEILKPSQGCSEPLHMFLLEDDQPVATITAKNWDAGASFPDFLQRLYSVIYGDGAPVLDLSATPPVFAEMGGNVCYVGEFFIARSHRRRVPIGNLSMLAYRAAMKRWSPDWFWGFVREKHARCGLPIQYHGARCYPRALTWRRPNDFHLPSDRFVCSSSEEIRWSMRSELQSL